MQLNDLQPRHPRKRARSIGRGGKRGKTSGRGTKGQKARAGHKMRPELRDLIKKLPKLRGYRFQGIAEKPRAVSLVDIAALFNEGEVVNTQALVRKGLLRGNASAKVLGSGKLDKKLTVKGLLVSHTARQAIEKAGGAVS